MQKVLWVILDNKGNITGSRRDKDNLDRDKTS